MRIGGLGPTELLLIVLIILLLFGASKLADIGGSLGRGIREFRKAVQDEDKPAAEQPDKPASQG
ncbi:MAG: twin-arginine translocase TatA/TatE family subunit [Caldilineales bacterium]|nr:twin-arginine translocase TatA/TatE family subunit [Caldilineales bacterium]MDW8316481.1 twin-arginine translocase TatA/TatE family subunit [Anaerolineae bacterium]